VALTLIKEDGTGKVDANSYADVADADAYHEAHLYAAAWTAAAAENKTKALVMATRLIDAQFQFNGVKTSGEQALQWPRARCVDPDRGGNAGFLSLPLGAQYLDSDRVPKAVVDATCEMARELLISDRTGDPIGEGLLSTYMADSGMMFDKKDRRPVISHLAQAMLAKYGSALKSGSGMVRLQRG
jgi:hypothetical protein